MVANLRFDTLSSFGFLSSATSLRKPSTGRFSFAHLSSGAPTKEEETDSFCFVHPGLEPRRLVFAFLLQREKKRKTDHRPMSGGGLYGWEEANDLQEYGDNAKNTLHYQRFGK